MARTAPKPAFARSTRNEWAQAHAKLAVCPSLTVDQWVAGDACRCGHPETHASVRATLAARLARKQARKAQAPAPAPKQAKAAPKLSAKLSAKAPKLTARQQRERAAYEARKAQEQAQGQASATQDADAKLAAEIAAAQATLRKLRADAKRLSAGPATTQARLRATKRGAAAAGHSAVVCK